MRTPAGSECPYFYGNYHRGGNREECRLIGQRPQPGHWTRDLCAVCPVPKITAANACPNMVLTAWVQRPFAGFFKRVRIKAYCTFSKQAVDHPEIGCGRCHPAFPMTLPPEETK